MSMYIDILYFCIQCSVYYKLYTVYDIIESGVYLLQRRSSPRGMVMVCPPLDLWWLWMGVIAG